MFYASIVCGIHLRVHDHISGSSRVQRVASSDERQLSCLSPFVPGDHGFVLRIEICAMFVLF